MNNLKTEKINSRSSTQQRRELIVNTSIDCFIRKGFHQTSIRDIAKQANISLGNFYNYFDSKESLIKEIAHIEATELGWIDELVNGDDSALLILENFVVKYLEYVEQRPNVILTIEILAESLRNPEISKPYDANRKKLISGLSGILSSGIKSGQFSANLDEKESPEIMLDMIEGLAIRSALSSKNTSKKSRKALLNLIYNSVRV